MASGSAEGRDARGLLGDDAGVVDPDHGPKLRMQTVAVENASNLSAQTTRSSASDPPCL